MPSILSRTRLPHRLVLGFWLAALTLAGAAAWSAASHLGPVGFVDRYLLDSFVVQTSSGEPASDTIVVDIDEASLSALGQWPWPRYRVADLVTRIAADEPSAIAMDIVFPEADRVSLDQIQRAFERDFGIQLAFQDVPAGLSDNDAYLGAVMARVDAIGARYFYFDHATRSDRALRPGLGFDGRIDLLSLPHAHGVLNNVDAIDSQTRTSGFINSGLDADGVLRRLPVLIEYDGVVHASLALAATMRALGVQSGHVESDTDGLSILIGSHRIPIDANGRALLRFNGPSSRYDSVPAVDVLAGRVPAADLRGKVVFIGSSAFGLRDAQRTPVDPAFSGLKIQSVMAQNILDDSVVRTPKWGTWLVLLLAVLAALAFSALFAANCGMAVLLAYSALGGATLVAIAAVAFVRSGLFLPIGGPLLVLGALLLLAFVARFAVTQYRARRWREELENARQVTIESMAAVAETRDSETGAHIKRTQHYVRAIAERLRRTGQHPDVLTPEYIDLLFLSAPLHDIGKVGVPDHILLKPGRLTAAEKEIMKEHAEFGRKIILNTAKRIEGDNFLSIAGEIAASHHEKWDGTGYPAGLAGQDIPLSGRIMTVADIYDALISRRCYKEPFPHVRATEMMNELRAKTFDPTVLDAFFAIEAEILKIAERFRDAESDILAHTEDDHHEDVTWAT